MALSSIPWPPTNLDNALNLALSFESLWLRSKSSYYMNIANSYLDRANIIDERK